MWKDKFTTRIENRELPLTLQDVEDMDVVDMMNDMKAHSIRRMTKDQKQKF